MMLSVEPVAACICIWAAGEELEFRCVAHYLAAGNSEVKLELAAGNILFFCLNRNFAYFTQKRKGN